ncbi:hypothetical protein DFH06DRAFT_1345038 [Mycena polygramma]|nr:hypothetical protein DFH06DRAFT_1345038 [Mycena polygramma]
MQSDNRSTSCPSVFATLPECVYKEQPAPYSSLSSLPPRSHFQNFTLATDPMATTSAEKTAEFAKLFDLFEMLANRRSRRTPATGSTLDDTCAITVPADLEPVFRSLATAVPPRQPLSGRARRNTVAALGRTTFPDDDDSDSDVESVAKFPLGKTYTFTFKMMIHKLYQADESSTSQLAEKEQVKKVEAAASPPVADGHVRFKAEVTVGGKKTMPLAPSRTRSHSVAGPSRMVANTRAPSATSATPPPITLHDDARAVKKRCIGRRKSVSGPLSPASPVGEGWIYDCRRLFRRDSRARHRRNHHLHPSYPSAAAIPVAQTGTRKIGSAPRRVVSAITKTVEAAAVESAPRTCTKRRLSE